jgi:transcriptional regulator with XRE-family HTH domain
MFEDLKAVRKRAGLTQAELAARAGLDRPNLSAIEGGRRTMSVKLANRVLDALDEDDAPSAADLVIGNRIKAFQKAKKRGDLGGMFDSATAVIKAGAATPGALPLFEEMIGEIEDAIDEEDGLDTDDDRDLFGRVKPVLKGSDDEDDGRDLFGRVVSSPDGDDGDDGRDLFGRVIRPVDEDEDDEDLEGDDDGRDMFGRRIGA